MKERILAESAEKNITASDVIDENKKVLLYHENRVKSRIILSDLLSYVNMYSVHCGHLQIE